MKSCLCISTPNIHLAEQQIAQAEMAELRTDLMGISPEAVGALVGKCSKTIVTCRTTDTQRAEAIYRAAIDAGAWAIDIDLHDMEPSLIGKLAELAHASSTLLILSRHFHYTPDLDTLRLCAEGAFERGADVAKIITTAQTTEQAIVPTSLYRTFNPATLVAFAMGECGRFTRTLSLLLGAPYTYIAPSAEESTAAGQPTADEVEGRLKEGFGLSHLSLPREVTPTGSKSEAQRYIVAATLAKGSSTIANVPDSADTLAAIDLACNLGATASIEGTTLTLTSRGAESLSERLGGEVTTLNVGESALLARLIIPIAASLLRDGKVTIEGRGTLLRRDLSDAIKVAESLGVECCSDGGKLPITLSGRAVWHSPLIVDGSHSSQATSGTMMAAAIADFEEPIEICVAHSVSTPYIALTSEVLDRFGVVAGVKYGAGSVNISVEPGRFLPSDVKIAVDWSSAGYFAAAYAVAQSRIGASGCYTLSATLGTSQPDEVVLMLLATSGARIEVDDEHIIFLPSDPLSAICYDATHTPDLIPTLAIVALFAEGESHISGLNRLTNKESNRTEALIENLLAIGADATIRGDELVIRGGSQLHSAPIRTHGDHRIAMAFTVAALLMDSRPTLDNLDCVAKSFPSFFRLLNNTTDKTQADE